MKEIIESISETDFKTNTGYYDPYYDGYVIKTNKQEIKMGITNSQGCCENWGYFTSEDDLTRFIGATLLDIKVTDTCLVKEKLINVYDGDVMFIDIETSEGVLQFVAYNSHNGYYGHNAVVISEQLNISETI